MPDPLPSDPTHLRELARLLREGGRLTPATQQALADLIDHLADTLSAPSSSAASARPPLEQAALAVESEAPLLTGLVARIVDTLRNIGI